MLKRASIVVQFLMFTEDLECCSPRRSTDDKECASKFSPRIELFCAVFFFLWQKNAITRIAFQKRHILLVVLILQKPFSHFWTEILRSRFESDFIFKELTCCYTTQHMLREFSCQIFFAS